MYVNVDINLVKDAIIRLNGALDCTRGMIKEDVIQGRQVLLANKYIKETERLIEDLNKSIK